MEQKPTYAEVERKDFIKQEVAAEDTKQVEPNSGSHLETIYVKTETPDAELEAVTVKDEPIDWKQEPQVNDEFQSITTKERIEIMEDHPQTFLELVTSEESVPPSQPSSSQLVSSSKLQLPSSQSLPSISSHLLRCSTSLSKESVVQSGALSSISMSCQNFSAPASQPSNSSFEDDSTPKRKKKRNQLGEVHQLISAATEASERIQARNKESNEFSSIGQAVIDSLQKVNPDQALEAERIIFNVLYMGQKGTLSKNSHIVLT